MATIKTQRLVLRPITLHDLHTTHAYAGSAENTAHMIFLPNDTLEDTRRFLADAEAEWKKANATSYEFAILFQDHHIGTASLYLSENRTVGELAWIVHRDYQGMGIATEAALAVRDFAIRHLHVKKLTAHCDCRNAGSERVMKKIGMTLERDDGIRYNKSDGQPSKEYLYSLFVG